MLFLVLSIIIQELAKDGAASHPFRHFPRLFLAFTLDACTRRCVAHHCRADMRGELTTPRPSSSPSNASLRLPDCSTTVPAACVVPGLGGVFPARCRCC